ncbi:MAG: 9-O-acetylesterase, partial [Burkholderiales bacterium]|nr:9-O-acetylesterase [Opitutaceae bacterium]
QRDAPVPVWGSAAAGEVVVVDFAGQTKRATADAAGRWLVKLEPMPASAEPQTLHVRGRNVLALSDVLVGEVWLASGQSNMAYGLAGADDATTDIAKADDPQLRFFQVKMQTAGEPQFDARGEWKLSSPKTAPGFSAVAYYFARELRAQLGVPVAVIQSAWGGTPAQAWTSMDALRLEPPLTRHLASWEQAVAKRRALEASPQLMADYERDIARWKVEVRPTFDAAMKAHNAAKAAGKDPGEKPVAAWPEPANPDPMGVPSPSARPSTPSVIFNAMIAPLAPYALRGVLWYQGEANAGAGLEYRTLLPRLIADWRQRWDAELPFLFVQLPGWEHDPKPAEFHAWPWLREAQLLTLQTVPRTGMAVAIDLGDPRDVHPKGKRDVGLRLALAARQLAYGESLVASGPRYREFAIEGGAIRVRFSTGESGLTLGQAPWRADGVEPNPADRLIGFTIAGADRGWVEADAKIDGDSILVSSPQVSRPVAVRYAWANFPRCNLYNRQGLPASPFRTDDWPLPTATADHRR